MNHLLSRATKRDVRLDPFPHIVIQNAVDPALCDQLLKEYPPLEVITKGASYVSNQRFSYPANDVINGGPVSNTWKEFVELHVSKEFWNKIVDLLGDEILKIAPQLAATTDALKDYSLGIRNQETYTQRKLLLDAQISVNTPVTEKVSSVKIAHLDNGHELFAGLWYLRPENDTSSGADLELYRYKGPKVFHGPRLIDDRYVERVSTVKYEHNTFILFLNSINALHGVTPRSITSQPRYLFNVLGEVEHPLFDLSSYKENFIRRLMRHFLP
jgi:hypothetical protein